MTRALVLSGGGSKGAYQVGVLQHLMLDCGRDYEILCGVSVGALNTSYLAQAKLGQSTEAFKKLRALWLSLNDRSIKKDWPLGKISALWNQSVYCSQPLIDMVKNKLDLRAIANSGRTLRVGAVNWETGDYASGTEKDPDLALWVLASSAFPVMLQPIRLLGQLWGDGGIRNITPLNEAIQLGATEIDVILCSNPDLPNRWDASKEAAIPGFALRAVNLMVDEVMRGDLGRVRDRNVISRYEGIFRNLRPTVTDAPKQMDMREIKLRVFQPRAVLTDDSLSFDPAEIQRMMQVGYEDAKAAA